MRIVIKKDAAEIYRKRIHPDLLNQAWYEMLQKVQGKTLRVETKYLFHDQYNTAPIPGVSSRGIRIMQESVERVLDDTRQGKARCQWCGKTVPWRGKGKPCPECGESGYLERLW